jgi:hypothetical protein
METQVKVYDKQKLYQWVDSFIFPHCLPLESKESNETAKLIIQKKDSFIKWANEQINVL